MPIPPPPPPPTGSPPSRSVSPLSKRPSTPPSSIKNPSPTRNTRNPNLSASSTSSASRPPRPNPMQRNISSASSQHSNESGERRRSYVSPQQQTQFIMSNMPAQLQQPSLGDGSGLGGGHITQTDANLLMASLERPAVEDQAESTLLQVLERRQVTFANQDNVSSTAHRRNRTDAQIMLNLDMTNAGDGVSRTSQSTDQSGLQISRPLLINRAASLGRSRRNLMQGSNNASSFGRSASRSYDASDEIFHSLSDPDGPRTDGSPAGNYDGQWEAKRKSSFTEESHGISILGAPAPTAVLPRPSLERQTSYKKSARANRHWRALSSALPKPSEIGSDGVGDNIPGSAKSSISGVTGAFSSTVMSGLSTPGERARYIAMTMKASNPESAVTSSNMQESNSLMEEGALSDLVNLVEAKRDEEESRESAGLISGSRGGSRGGGSRGSNGSRSRRSGKMSGNASASGSQSGSHGGSSGFSGRRMHRPHKPFAGVSSAWGDGPMSNIDNLFQVAEQVQELFELPQIPEDDEEEFISSGFSGGISGSMRSADLAAENAAFLSQLAESHPEIVEEIEEEAGGDFEALPPDEQTPILQKAKMKRIQAIGGSSRHWLLSRSLRKGPMQKFFRWLAYVRHQLAILSAALDSSEIKEACWSYFQTQVSIFIVPALALAAFFYYRLNNPSFEFMPTDASISWLILFSVRLYLTLTLAYVTEYLFVDILATRSPVSVKVIGPLATLYTINAKGWPFIVTMWGVWNFILLHGQTPFNESWLYFTDIEIFSENRGDGIVQSKFFKEVLLSMVLAGVATSIKRTIIALYLGKRVYNHYKPKLEKLMVDMLLLTEVAELGNALDEFEFEKVDAPVDGDTPRETKKSIKINEDMRTSAMKDLVKGKKVVKKEELESEDEGTDNEEEVVMDGERGAWNRLRTLSNSSDADNDDGKNETVSPSNAKAPAPVPAVVVRTLTNPLDTEAKDLTGDEIASPSNANAPLPIRPSAESTEQENVSKPVYSQPGDEVPPPIITREHDIFVNEPPALDNVEPPIPSIHEPVQGVLRQVSTTAQIKSLLDRWEEPVNKMDKEDDPSIHEILQFRKALAFLDDTHPFSLSFGPANTRDLCIKSSKNLYKRLLGFSPGSTVLHFDVLGVLAYEADGNFDDKKAKGLVRLFRPDKFDEVSLLAFVQSCDGVYKRLRYLRASVGNSTLIDYVLENIFNAFFYFFLALAILSVLDLNPWTLLVSLSTILVSFAFAVGPSAAKLIEGMMMIAVRRPFDLGDRISVVDISGKPDPDDPGFKDSWLVEDVNLFTTTLRLARTNEVSTINNGALANTRIINHNRSNNASISISLPMKISVSHDEVQVVRSAIDQYIQDNPRVWSCLVNFRVTKVDPNMELIVYTAKLNHVKNWQDMLPILQNKGDLEKFCTEILMQLGVNYDSPFINNSVYIREMPEQLPPEAMHVAP